MSVKRACELLKVPRSRVYYWRKGESRENLELMKRIEEIYNKDPAMGYRRMKAMLEEVTGKVINKKRIRRLIKILGLKGIFPRRRVTQSEAVEVKDLVKGKVATRPNQVWVSDITYIRVEGGYAYGVFIMDMYSRKILSYEISNTMDERMCVKALERGATETTCL